MKIIFMVIAPGETMRGRVGYQVLENATGFVFDAHAWEEGSVFEALPW